MVGAGFIGLGTPPEHGRRGKKTSASISGLTVNSTYGPTAQIGVELSGSISGLTGREVVVHRWVDGGGVISGAINPTYTPVTEQDLQTLRYAPTVDGKEILSTGYVVRHAPAVNVVAPVLSGTLEPGHSVTLSDGTWADAAGGVYQHRIHVDGAEVSASNSYVIQIGDSEGVISGEVAYVNSGGTVAAAASGTLTVGTFVAPAVFVAAQVTGSAVAGETMTGVPASFSGAPSPIVVSLWEVSDDGASSWTSTGDTDLMSPVLADGKFYRFGSTGSNALGSAVSYSDVVQALAAPVTEIVGTFPVLAALTHWRRTWEFRNLGDATAPTGQTLTDASPVREMTLDNGATWIAYNGTHVAAGGEIIRARETWATVEGLTRTFTTNSVTVALDVPDGAFLTEDGTGFFVTEDGQFYFLQEAA